MRKRKLELIHLFGAALLTFTINTGFAHSQDKCATVKSCAQEMVEIVNDIKKENEDISNQLQNALAKIGKLEEITNGMETITLYQCPANAAHRPGNWATFGCLGQYGTAGTCNNYSQGGGDTIYRCEAQTFYRKK